MYAKQQKIWLSVPLLLTVGIHKPHAQEAVETNKPNIIFILADDLGWTDLGIMGSDYYETPNIDRLAAEGIHFDHAYAAAANSAPSRACMMTGMYTPRHGVYTVSPPDRGDRTRRRWVPIPNTDDVRSEFVTIAEVLQQKGYQCGHIGKWHLGDDAEGTGPLSQGFSSNVAGSRAGAPFSYFYPYCSEKGKCIPGLEAGSTDEYLTDRLTSEAVSFITSHQKVPFFLYLSHYAVHTPLQAPDSLIRKYRNKTPGKYHHNPIYAAMIEKLDNSVGEICRVVETLGIADRTLLVFYSDNGGSEPITDNYPLRGGKGMPYEGGIRVPLIMRWPGKIEAGSRSSVPVTGVDLYPTFTTLASGKPASELDGKDIFTLIQKNETERDLFWHFPAYLESYLEDGKGFRAKPYSCIRSGDWKLIYQNEDETAELYNLRNDPGEMVDLSGSDTKKKDELYQRLMSWIKETHAPVPFALNPFYIQSSDSK